MYRRDAVARQSLPDIEYFGGWSAWVTTTALCHHSDKVVPSAREIARELVSKFKRFFLGKPQNTSFTCKRTREVRVSSK